ncbi:hypothetical protein H0I76_17165 [Limibaculum sp. M0105]|uniref:Carboxypeptidase regulatory-like domain-containing protein n=1 Tax=Thermohalobaculum xanthum TaxID=2753746 RepID=A0A8J7M927_9RHOB|nr:hypothetical protein [Thermohalobaculum xanthum]MBK0400931.1 hypothetical protein [Thermohalobaculum xanthum]
MIARRLVATVMVLALALGGCAPPPRGLAPPAASETAINAPAGSGAGESAEDESGQDAPLTAPPGGRLAALRVTVANAPPELLDDQRLGVLTVRRGAEHRPTRLIFADGALAVYRLPAGVYRVESIAGYDCGEIYLTLGQGAAPLSLGGLELSVYDDNAATLSGQLPTPRDLDGLAGLTGVATDEIDASPLERRQGIVCRRDPRAVSRPDIDPNIRKLTPTEIALSVLLGGLIGAAGGYAIAAGTFIFVSGTAGGAVFLGL